MTPVTLELPWPPKELSPNERVHWATKYSRGKRQKEAGHILASRHRKAFEGAGWVCLAMTFHPPGAYRFDADNLVARMKWALDGIAAGIGIDDRNFRLDSLTIAAPKPPHGCVVVTLAPMPKAEAA
jgi:crossover junction endodeoxyribonuclease RusA